MQAVENLEVAVRVGAIFVEVAPLEVEDEDVQPAACRNPRIQLPERAGGGVARVGKQGLALVLARGVELLKHFARHIDLAAHAECQRFGQRQRNRGNGAQIFGHIFADKAVAARRAEGEIAVFVGQRHRESVNLRLDRIDGVRHLGSDAVEEVVQLLKGEHIGKTAHLHAVRDLLKFVQHPAPDAPRGRIRVVVFGMCRLQLLQAAEQRVIFKVRNFGNVVHIILLCVMRQARAQRFDFVSDCIHTAAPLSFLLLYQFFTVLSIHIKFFFSFCPQRGILMKYDIQVRKNHERNRTACRPHRRGACRRL